MLFDIITKYNYGNNEKETIEIIDEQFYFKNSEYVSENFIIKIENNLLKVAKNKDLSYTKVYDINNTTTSYMYLGENKFITKIKTNSFIKENNTYTITASEYTTNNEKLFDVKINIKIKGDENVKF